MNVNAGEAFHDQLERGGRSTWVGLDTRSRTNTDLHKQEIQKFAKTKKYILPSVKREKISDEYVQNCISGASV